MMAKLFILPSLVPMNIEVFYRKQNKSKRTERWHFVQNTFVFLVKKHSLGCFFTLAYVDSLPLDTAYFHSNP